MDSNTDEEFQINQNPNEIYKLINDLSYTTFNECINHLKNQEKNKATLKLLNKLSKQRQLDSSLVPDTTNDYIYQQYLNAYKKFKDDFKVPLLSFGIKKIIYDIYLYVKKEHDLSLNYINNYKNITPITYDQYTENKNNSGKNSISELYGDAGMNLNGYTFEFNVNFFLGSLKEFLELPNLIFDLSKNYCQTKFYHELDISYYAKNKIDNDNKNLSIFKTSAYFRFNNKKVFEFLDSKDFKIFEYSLILGEVKLRFPKKIGNKEEKSKETLRSIILGLMEKLSIFYELYKGMSVFTNNSLKIIQLILFYDTIQISKLNLSEIKTIISQNLNYIYNINNIQIHFYIVYTFPALTTVSLSNLSNEIEVLKKLNKKQNEKIEVLKKLNKKQNEKIEELNNTVKNVMEEIKKLKNNNSTNKIDLINFNDEEQGEIRIDTNTNNEGFSLINFLEKDQKKNEIENNANISSNEQLYKDVFNIFAEIEDKNKKLNERDKNNNIDEEMKNKFNNTLKKFPNSKCNESLIIPPHDKLNEEQSNILNTFLDNLTNAELERIILFGCHCNFCYLCKLKLSLTSNEK